MYNTHPTYLRTILTSWRFFLNIILYRITSPYFRKFPSPCLTKERITKTDRHRLHLHIVVERRLAQLTANTRLLESTEWKLPVERVVRVDPDGSSFQRVGHFDGGVKVAGMDGGGETVGRIVADRDGVLLGLELGDGADGAENFFLYNLHVFGDIREDGRLDEEALVADALAAGFDGGAGFLALLNVATKSSVMHSLLSVNYGVLPHDPVELHL